MSGFDPDKYLAGKQGAAFDPDKYLAEKKTNSVPESALMHSIQGAAGGFLDEASGVTEAAGRAFGVKGLGGSFDEIGRDVRGPTLDMEALKQAYKEGRDKKRATLDAQAKQNPVASGVGNFVGMVASPINKVAKGLSAAKAGAVLGGINALGSSDAEDAQGMLIDTATGTALGLGAGKLAEKASPYIERGARKVSGALREGAKAVAARAIGAERGSIKALGYQKVKDAGAQALDEGLLGLRDSTEDMIAKNAAVKSRGGKMMGKAYDAIDEAGASTFNPREVAEKVDDKLAPTWRTALNKGETNQFDNTIETILERGPGDIPLSEAQLLKKELGDAANWKNKLNVTPKEQMARDAYGIVSDQIDEAVKIGAKAVDNAGLTDTLKRGKELFGKASTAEVMLENKLAREQGNKFIGLTDTIAGAGALGYGGTTGDWETAGSLVVGKKILQKYGPKIVARGLNRTSQMLMKSPTMESLAQKAPATFHEINGRIASKLPKVFDAAENEEIKGKDKWVVDGFSKLDQEIINDPQAVDKLFDTEKGRSLLITASDLKPGSKAMDALTQKIKTHIKGAN